MDPLSKADLTVMVVDSSSQVIARRLSGIVESVNKDVFYDEVSYSFFLPPQLSLA